MSHPPESYFNRVAAILHRIDLEATKYRQKCELEPTHVLLGQLDYQDLVIGHYIDHSMPIGDAQATEKILGLSIEVTQRTLRIIAVFRVFITEY